MGGHKGFPLIIYWCKTLKDGRLVETYDPEQIAEVLSSSGAILLDWEKELRKEISVEIENRIGIVEDLAKRAQTRFYISQADSWFTHHIESKTDWPFVKKMLVKHGLLIEKQPQQKGPPEVFLRLTLPPDVLLQGRVTALVTKSNETKIDQFWHELLNDQ